MAVEGDGTFAVLVQPRQAIEQGGLARSIGTDQARDLTARHVEGDAVERHDAAEPHRDSANGKQAGGRRCRGCDHAVFPCLHWRCSCLSPGEDCMLSRNGAGTKGCFPGPRRPAQQRNGPAPGTALLKLVHVRPSEFAGAVGQCRAVDKHNEKADSLFGADALETPAALAAALAPPAAPGHFDELRGGVSATSGATAEAAHAMAPHGLPTGPWLQFFEHLGRDGFDDLSRRTVNLERQVRDNGVSYNVYAAANGPQRPWSLDLFPLIVSPQSWQQIETGVLQRVKLLDRIMSDVYGSQQLLERNLLPPALVQGHPGYLRAMHGVKPAGGMHLHIAAFDLARDPDGSWWVVSQRTQAPSGLGYLLENRLIISRLFPEAFRGLKVQRLAATYRAL